MMTCSKKDCSIYSYFFSCVCLYILSDFPTLFLHFSYNLYSVFQCWLTYILVHSLQNIEIRSWHNSKRIGHLPESLQFNLNETSARSLYMRKNSYFRLSGSIFLWNFKCGEKLVSWCWAAKGLANSGHLWFILAI